MGVNWLARGLAVTGLSAVSAVAAHEGPAALGAGRPLLVALLGAAVAALGVAALLGSAVSRAARAARVRRGDLLAARLDPDTAPGASALVAALLVCQAGAHLSLSLAGVAAHGGPPAPPGPCPGPPPPWPGAGPAPPPAAARRRRWRPPPSSRWSPPPSSSESSACSDPPPQRWRRRSPPPSPASRVPRRLRPHGR